MLSRFYSHLPHASRRVDVRLLTGVSFDGNTSHSLHVQVHTEGTGDGTSLRVGFLQRSLLLWQETMTHCCVFTDVTFTTVLQCKDIVMFYRIVQDLRPCLDGAHLCGPINLWQCTSATSCSPQYACEISWMQLGGKPIVVITRGL